jgi:hypothetical protein
VYWTRATIYGAQVGSCLPNFQDNLYLKEGPMGLYRNCSIQLRNLLPQHARRTKSSLLDTLIIVCSWKSAVTVCRNFQCRKFWGLEYQIISGVSWKILSWPKCIKRETIRRHTSLFIFLLPYFLTCLLTSFLTYLLIYLLPYLLPYFLLTYLLTYLINTYLLTYLLTYILN